MYAAYKVGDHPELVRQLIRNGALRNLVSNSGETALSYAVRNGNIDSVKVLLFEPVPANFFKRPIEKPILFNIYDGNGYVTLGAFETALSVLLSMTVQGINDNEDTKHMVSIIKVLIDGSDPLDWDNEQHSRLLFETIFRGRVLVVHNNWGGIVEQILEIAEYLFEKTSIKVYPYVLYLLFEENYVKFAEFLLKKLLDTGQDLNNIPGLNFNPGDPTSPLFYATKKDMFDLLVNTFNLNSKVTSPDGQTLILWLVRNTGEIDNTTLFEIFESLFENLHNNNSYEEITEYVNTESHNMSALGECFALRRERPNCGNLIDILLSNGANPILALHSGLA